MWNFTIDFTLFKYNIIKSHTFFNRQVATRAFFKTDSVVAKFDYKM